MFIESPAAPEPDPQSNDGEIVELAQAATPGAESIGQIAALQGTVTITRTDGTKVPAADGTPIFQGDLVETGADGAIGITFADDSTFSLAEAGSLVIDEMVYDPGTQQGKSALNVATGVFTFVSGQIAKTGVDTMVIKTPVAVIGIRGTEGGGRAGPEGTTNTYSLFGGEMSVSTLGGGPPVIMNQPGQTTQMTSAYVPPTRPVTLPPAALQRFYAKAAAVAPKAVFSQQAGPGTDAPAAGPTDAAQGGPTDTPADTPADEAGAAAAQAFEQALAAGDLDAAMAAAIDGAAQAELEAALTADPNAFGTAESGNSIMDRMVDNFLLGVTGQIDHMGAGDGKGAGNTRFTDNFFEDGIGHVTGGDLDDLEGGFGFFDDFMDGHGFGEGEDDFFDEFFDDPFDIFEKDAFEDFFDFGFEDFLFDVFMPFEFEGGVLGFNEDPFFLDEDETAFVTASVFDDFVYGTTGNDTLSGGTGNTRFTMVQGTTLGGTDTTNGGAGTDELAFESLSGMAIIFDAAANGGKGVVSYSNTSGSITGTVTMDSIEQIYVDDGAEARVRFPIELAHGTGFGYILVGTSGDDTGATLSVADGVNLSSTYADLNEYSYTGGGSLGYTVSVDSTGDPYDAGDRIFGSIIMGNAGDDTIIGTASSDILYGGAGDDSITTGKSGEDGDTVFGGAGADTIILNESGTLTGSIKGGGADGSDDSTGATIGSNADTIELSKASGTYDLTQMIIQGVEALDFSATGVTLTAVNTFFQSLQTIRSDGTTTLKGQGDLDLSGVTNTPDGDVSALGLDTSITVNGSIRDFNDSSGRTITGTTGQNTILGFGGGDTIDLISDSAVDKVVFTSKSDTAASAGGAANFDVITNFDRADSDIVVFTQDGNLADFNDVSNTGDSVYVFSTVATNGADLTAAEVVFISNTVSNSALTTANFVDVIAAIGTITAGTATAADAENDAIFVVTDGSGKSGIYLYTNQDGADSGNTTVEADELTLLATFDAVLQDGDLTTVDTVNSV